MEQLGENWQKRKFGIANEHFFSDYIRNKVGARILNLGTKQVKKNTLLLACLPEEQHELGLLCFALHAMENGFNCVMLGRNLPLDELERSITVINPSLSIVYGCVNNAIFEACKNIVDKLNTHIAVVERKDSAEHNFSQKGLYKLSEDFDMAINAIRKIIAYNVKK